MDAISEDRFNKRCEDFKKWLHVRTAGLLEFDYNTDWEEQFTRSLTGRPRDGANSWRNMTVQYIHRTVHDFLTGSEEGRRIAGRSHDTEETVDRAWILSFLVSFIEDVRSFSVRSLYDVAWSPAWLSQQAVDIIDVLDKLCRTLFNERVQTPSGNLHNWFYELEVEYDHPAPIFHDVPGLLITNTPLSSRYMLTKYGTEWTPYYKGYLAMCAIIYTLDIEQDTEVKASIKMMFQIVAFLKDSKADLTTPHPYSSNHGVLAKRSPAVRLLVDFCLVLLGTPDRQLTVHFVWDMLRILDDLKLCGQALTIFRNGGCEEIVSTDKLWNSTAYPMSNLMFTFDAGDVHMAMLLATKEYRQELDLMRKSDQRAEAILRHIQNQFRKHCWQLTKDIRGCRVHNGGFVFKEFQPEAVARINERLFLHRGKGPINPATTEMTIYELFDKSAYRMEPATDSTGADSSPANYLQSQNSNPECLSVPAPRDIDLDFNATWPNCLQYIVPLDPHLEIGPHNWKERASHKVVSDTGDMQIRTSGMN
ncbi:hypothetical protein OHC33_006671 [Knufia fluminis]|uniref:DUF7791 domain-containing protein n=1 Tax=Knufia fluminis TaxID=191047 RepID=A0AAN8EU89_9EURO|nr:hypothetical protein OHC33_006671 [Knufia fluminis]